jgi:uncharacterized protein YjcR
MQNPTTTASDIDDDVRDALDSSGNQSTPMHMDPRKMARSLYWQGWRVSSVAKHLGLKRPTVEAWKQRDKWDDASPIAKVESALETKLCVLIAKDVKTGGDYKEIDLLMRQVERMARVHKYGETGKESDLNPNVAERLEKARKAPRKSSGNEFTEEQIAKIHDAFLEKMFDYQKVWYRHGNQRSRFLLKSRQIGATYYFAHEALDDALQTGRNQIFLSASKAQAYQFKYYMQAFAKEVCDVELTGDPIIIGGTGPNGTDAALSFLGTNSRTAQGRSGNTYLDEVFWVPKFHELYKLAGAMSLHKHWRKTLFSTPSTLGHPAYPIWTGKHYNIGRPQSEHVNFDVSAEALKNGRLCEDDMWRQVVTIMDALAGGCDLFDLEKLKREYNAHDFAQLLMCLFVDDGESLFSLAELQRCMVDSWDVWAHDFKPLSLRPFANKEVWIGYDPALSGDSAALAVIAPPEVPGGKFRLLHRQQFRGMDFEAQAEAIRQITLQYNVTYIGIDVTGIGHGVHQIVKQFFPRVVPISYSPEVKGRLVLKAINVISKARLEFDTGWTDVAQSFMAIKKTMTASGRKVTYEAARSQEIGHADLAWAVMHALDNEPFAGHEHRPASIMEFS